MNKITQSAMLLVGLSLPLMGACNRPAAPATSASSANATASEPQTVLGKSVGAAIDEARRELETQNIDIGRGSRIGAVGRGHHFQFSDDIDRNKAQITPQGDLLIEGKAVPVTPAQHTMVVDYRKQILAVAETGMSIGVQGADLAGKAVVEAFSGLMHGDSKEAGKHLQAESERMEASAKRICAQLPALLASQQRLAASLPAFKPYATMTQADIDDCMKDHRASVTTR